MKNSPLLPLAVFWTGLHTCFTIYIAPSFPIPYALCFLGALLMVGHLGFSKIISQIRFEWRLIVFYGLSIVVTIATLKRDYFSKSLLGLVQLGYSIGLAVLLITVMNGITRLSLARWALCGILIITAVALMERLGPIKRASDAFREFASPGWFYDSDSRDFEIHGQIRSKAFAPEPSVAASSLFCLSMVFVWCARFNIRLFAVWIIAILGSLITIGSPVIAICLVVGLITTMALWVFDLIRDGKSVSLLGVVGAMPFVAIGMSIIVMAQLQSRIGTLQDGDMSFAMRVSGSAEFTADFIKNNLIAGTGIVGDLNMLTEDLRDFYTKRGDVWIALLDDDIVKKMVSNNIAIHFIYWGGLMGVVSAGLIMSSFRVSSRYLWGLVMLHLGILWMAMGGYNTALVWCFAACIVAAARAREFESI